MSQQSILAEIAAERDRQDERWRIQSHKPKVWCAALGEEVDVANLAFGIYFFGSLAFTAEVRRQFLLRYRQRLISVAAVAVAAIESLDREYDS